MAGKLVDEARDEVDQKKRQQMYRRIEELVYNDYTDVWLYYPMQAVAYSQNVRGYNHEMYVAGREGYHFSHDVWLKDGKP